MRDEADPPRGLRTFGIIWVGQLVSLVGSGLTAFALGVWVYQQTGSVTRLALIFASATLPTVLLSPFAGAYVDRWDRRRVMLLSDAVAAVGTLAIVTLLALDRLEIWHIYAGVGLGAAANAFQWPAYSAATTLLIPRRHLARAAGMVQFARAGAQVLAPVLGGYLVVSLEIQGVVLIDFATFLFAVLTLMMVRIPAPPESAGVHAGRGSLLREVRAAWRFLIERPGLVRLLSYFTWTNFFGSQAIALAIPLVLAFAAPDVVGVVLSVGASGMVVGGLVLSVWGGPRRRILGVLGAGALLGASMVAAGLRPWLPLVALALFGFYGAIPVVNGCSQAIWQSKVPPDIQGRVFALRRMFATLSTPLGHIVAGPLADGVFKPLLVEGGPLAGSVGRVLGTGPSRGLGLQFVVLGCLALAAAARGLLSPRLMAVESDLPDAMEDDEPARVPQRTQA